MKIVFVSDTHGDEEVLKKIVDFSKGYDAIIHTGDVLPYGVEHSCFISDYISTVDNIYFVRGNTDYFDGMRLMGKDVSEFERVLTFGNIRIFATHGFIKSMTAYESEARQNDCNILVYGHTHVKKLEKKENLIILNPGSPSRPRDYAPSFAIFEDGVITLYNAFNFSVIEKLHM